MPWSPAPTDTQETGPGWNTTTTVTAQPPVPGWSSAPQPVYAFADATITVNAAGLLVMKGSAPAVVDLDAAGGIIGASLGAAELLGEGTVAFANAGADAVATFTPTADGLTSIVADAGFPYTFPIVFGGAPVLEVFTNASATVTIDAAADVELRADALADFTILADAVAASDTAGGFPYLFDFVFGGATAADLFPLVFPFLLS